MNTLMLFSLEVMLCLGISIVVISLLRPLLRGVLADICGTEQRADFWVMFTSLMLVISPLLVVVYFVPTAASGPVNVADEIRQTLFRTLLGDFLALSVIGKVIWHSVISPSNRAPDQAVETAQ